jgi:hypothetical protein
MLPPAGKFTTWLMLPLLAVAPLAPPDCDTV